MTSPESSWRPNQSALAYPRSKAMRERKSVLQAFGGVKGVIPLVITRTSRTGAQHTGVCVPGLAAVDDGDHRQHDRDLHQHADHGGQCRAGIEAEQADGRGHGQLEEVAGADQRRGRRDTMGLAEAPVE